MMRMQLGLLLLCIPGGLDASLACPYPHHIIWICTNYTALPRGRWALLRSLALVGLDMSTRRQRLHIPGAVDALQGQLLNVACSDDCFLAYIMLSQTIPLR